MRPRGASDVLLRDVPGRSVIFERARPLKFESTSWDVGAIGGNLWILFPEASPLGTYRLLAFEFVVLHYVHLAYSGHPLHCASFRTLCYREVEEKRPLRILPRVTLPWSVR